MRKFRRVTSLLLALLVSFASVHLPSPLAWAAPEDHTDAEAVSHTLDALMSQWDTVYWGTTYTVNPEEPLVLPIQSVNEEYGTSITWEWTPDCLMNEDGTVNVPGSTERLDLEATISRGEVSVSQEFCVYISPELEPTAP